MKNIKYILLSAILIGFTACNDEEDFIESPDAALPALTAGSANFSNYVSIGNSLTAGFTDNALFIAGQENSFPNTLSQKFALVGGGAFTQPLTSDNVGGLILGGNPVLHPVTGERLFGPRLVFGGLDDNDSPIIVPVSDLNPGAMTTTDFALNNPTGPFNNLGVPGAASFHLLAAGYGSLANFPAAANPYAIRVTGNTNATILELALAQSPSFVSLWIGNNDVLGYATSGGDATLGAITPQPTFDFSINTIVGALQTANVQGVMANIPYVTTIPHFTSVPHNPLDPSNPDFGPQIPLLNTIFGALNGIYTAIGQPERIVTFSTTEANAVVIKDESLTDISATITGALLSDLPAFEAFIAQFGLPPAAAPSVAGLLGVTYGQARQATEEDLLVLPSSSVIGTVNSGYAAFLVSQGLSAALAGQFSVEGVTLPLEDKWILIPTEQDEIKTATDNFNATLQSAASAAGFAFVDANALMRELDAGGFADGDFILTSGLISGGAFSLDGVHPTARGYALIANEFMKAIDATYGSNFEASGNLVDIGDYPTNYSPLLQ